MEMNAIIDYQERNCGPYIVRVPWVLRPAPSCFKPAGGAGSIIRRLGYMQ